MIIVEENTNLEIPGNKALVRKKRHRKNTRKKKREPSIRSEGS